MALLSFAAGFWLGRGESLLEFGRAHGRVAPRQSFSETELVVRDFKSRFADAYCRSISEPLAAEERAWREDKMHDPAADPDRADLSERGNSPAPLERRLTLERQRWANLLRQDVEILRDAYPLESVECDLLKFYRTHGMEREFEAFYLELQRRNPAHPAVRQFETDYRKLRPH